MTKQKNPHAVALGSIKSEKRAEASRENGKKGGKKKITPQIVRHGEVILKPTILPKDAILKEQTKKKIVAHSETGHHHVLEATKPLKVYMWKDDMYVEVPEIANLWHQKTGKDTHAPHKIAPAVYKIILKKEFDYFKGILRIVRD